MKEKLQINFKLLHEDAILPQYQKEGDAGFDLSSTQDILVEAGKIVIIPLGVASEIPRDWCVLLKDRSGLAAKQGLHVLGGVIDSNYRGEWKVILVNLGESDYKIIQGERITQGLLQYSPQADIVQVEELSDTQRGQQGFGSSGKV